LSTWTADPIIAQRRAGTYDDPYVSISENKKIVNNHVLLTEKPNLAQKVSVIGEAITWYELLEGTPTITQYVVDYYNGIVTFHPDNEGLTLAFVYTGEGVDYFPASRIWTDSEGGVVTETIQDIIDTQLHHFYFSTSIPTVSDGEDGDIWFVYQE